MSTSIIQATEPQAIIIVTLFLLLCELSRTQRPFIRRHIHRIQHRNGGNGTLDRDEGGAQTSELDVTPRVQRPFQDLVSPFTSHLGPKVLGIAKVEAVDGHDESWCSCSSERFGKCDRAGAGTRAVSAERSAGYPDGIGRMSNPTHFERPKSDIIPDVSIDGKPFLGDIGCFRLDVPLLLLEAVKYAQPDDDIGGVIIGASEANLIAIGLLVGSVLIPVRPSPTGFLGPVAHLEYRVISQHTKPRRSTFMDDGIIPSIEADLEVVLPNFSGGSPKANVGFRVRVDCVETNRNFFTWVKDESARILLWWLVISHIVSNIRSPVHLFSGLNWWSTTRIRQQRFVAIFGCHGV